MKNIFSELMQDMKIFANKICNNNELWNKSILEFPKDPLNGDISSNIALVIASIEGTNSKEIALELKKELSKIEYVAHLEVAGTGFLNFTIKAEKWHKYLEYILSESQDFWYPNIGNNIKIDVEYVSANPTGPLHIGHIRGAVFGDIISNILACCGYDVTREYYVNDVGGQIDILTQSVFLRYKEHLQNTEIKIDKNLYPGKFLKEIGKKLVEIHGDKLLNVSKNDSSKIVRDFSIATIMQCIKDDLKLLNIKHEVFVYESDLHKKDILNKTIDILKVKGLVYKGILPPPKGIDSKNWISKEQLLFKSSKFGDSQDRPLKRQDNSWAYFASDLAYIKDKIDRKFQILIYVLGDDHKGYVARIKAIIDILSDFKVKPVIKTTQLVNFIKDSIPLKMSKRAGTTIEIRDAVRELGSDVLRFMMIYRKNDQKIDFDFAKLIEKNRDNPLFYVQYAHVRIVSIINKLKQQHTEIYNKFLAKSYNLSLLSTEEEIQLIKLLTTWPKMILNIVNSLEPHKLSNYLINIASKFHFLWTLGKTKNEYLFIVPEDTELTTARLSLLVSIKKTLSKGLQLIGIKPLNEM